MLATAHGCPYMQYVEAAYPWQHRQSQAGRGGWGDCALGCLKIIKINVS